MPKNVFFLLCKTIKAVASINFQSETFFSWIVRVCSEMFAVDSYFLLGFATPCVSNEVTLEAIPSMIVMKDEWCQLSTGVSPI